MIVWNSYAHKYCFFSTFYYIFMTKELMIYSFMNLEFFTSHPYRYNIQILVVKLWYFINWLMLWLSYYILFIINTYRSRLQNNEWIKLKTMQCAYTNSNTLLLHFDLTLLMLLMIFFYWWAKVDQNHQIRFWGRKMQIQKSKWYETWLNSFVGFEKGHTETSIQISEKIGYWNIENIE